MAKFMYLYHGPATDMADMSEEQSKAIMEKWGVWMGRVGDALVDAGAPTAKGVVLKLMKNITNTEPKMWGSSIVRFGSYHFNYESDREGD